VRDRDVLAYLAYLQPRLDLFLADLSTLSLMDCGTDNKAGVGAAVGTRASC